MVTMWGDAPMDEVKPVWADALRDYTGDDIRGALDNCFSAYTDYPPTLPQFIGLCRDAKRLRAAGATKLDGPRGIPCPPEIKAQLEATLKKMRA